MILPLGQLAIKRLAAQVAPPRWLSTCCGGVARKKVSDDEIEYRRYRSITQKIYAEYGAVNCPDDSFLKMERFSSENLEELKSLHKDLRAFNRKNGVVPPPPEKRTTQEIHEEYLHGRWFHRRGFGTIPDSFYLGKDDAEMIETGRVAVEEYNKKHSNSSGLEFVSVLEVHKGCHMGNYNVVIQARDPAAAGVSIKLNANCYVPYRHVYQVQLHRPVPFMDLLHKDDSKEKNISASDFEALLFANLHNCPVIAQRLGLKRQELHGDKSRRTAVKLSLDDDSLMRVAEFSVNQRPNLHFLRALGAWVEKITVNKSMYHVIFEALDDDVERRFYSAVIVNVQGGDAEPEPVNLVAVDSPRSTMK